MRIGLRRRQIVDGDDRDVLALALDNRAQHHAADTAKSIDGNPYCHYRLLLAPVTASTRATSPAFRNNASLGARACAAWRAKFKPLVEIAGAQGNIASSAGSGLAQFG